MKLAYCILAHNDVDNLLRLVNRLLLDGNDTVVIHWDKKNPIDIVQLAKTKLDSKSLAQVFFADRISVAWGQWGVVEATLSCLKKLEATSASFDYVILLSASDYPLKSTAALKNFLLEHNGQEFIECVDPHNEPWVTQGLVHERYQLYHWINWRNYPKLFSLAVNLQKKLGIKRRLPKNLQARFGSQWWALTWNTVRQILQRSRHPKTRHFFKSTWVPDELFFQTLVAAIAPPEKIASQSLTFYQFSHQGRPLVFYNGHFDFLSQQPAFFARKLSPFAIHLRDQLDEYIDTHTFAIPAMPLAKQLDAYHQFIAVQWRGLPGRRVIGRQLDPWYGDLEWNKQPYFVIASYQEADLETLRLALNKLPQVVCFGELFADNHIDYALLDKDHPFYPNHQPALRDMKRPNFLTDLLQINKEHLQGFILRLPAGNEMEKVVIYDPQATLIYVQPEQNYWDNGALNWSAAFTHMILQDNLTEVRRTGKPTLVLTTKNHSLPESAIKQTTTLIGNLQKGFTC